MLAARTIPAAGRPLLAQCLLLLLLPLSLSLSPLAPRALLRCQCGRRSLLRMCSDDPDIENTLRASLSSHSMRAALFGNASDLLTARCPP